MANLRLSSNYSCGIADPVATESGKVQGRAIMLENTKREAAPPAVADSIRAPYGIEELAAQLVEQKVRPCLLQTVNGVSAGGVALRVPIQAALQSPMGAEHLMRRVIMLVHENVPLTLKLCELGAEDGAIRALEDFCGILRSALLAEGLASDGIGISMQSHLVPLQAYLLICTAILGRGPRYVILDSLQMRRHDNNRVQAEAETNWSFLWGRRHATPTIIPAYAASVTTRCPLLGDEAATAVLPEAGLQAPVESAWLPMSLNLVDFSDGHGRLHWNKLQFALETAVDAGDRILDRLHWPLPQQRSDAWQNRRLAVCVGGLGDLVVERGADPADLRCLQWIDETIARIHALLWDRSKSLALKTEPLPALLSNWPAVPWDCDIKKSDWDLRWRRAVASTAVRHRNMLVMSPYAVLPRAGASAGFVDLLPVLHHADAFSFAGPRVDGFRSCSEFANFHRRAWAVMQRRNAASLVAAGV